MLRDRMGYSKRSPSVTNPDAIVGMRFAAANGLYHSPAQRDLPGDAPDIPGRMINELKTKYSCLPDALYWCSWLTPLTSAEGPAGNCSF